MTLLPPGSRFDPGGFCRLPARSAENLYKKMLRFQNTLCIVLSDTRNERDRVKKEEYTMDNVQNAAVQSPRPVGQLKTNRGLLKFILLSVITLGIYAIVAMSSVSSDVNVICSRYDGKKTMHYCLLFFLVGPITLGIADLVWYHRISNRIGGELQRRGLGYDFGAKDFWLWGILGSMIVVGPFIYTHKLFKAMNALSENYNVNG